MGFYTPQVPVDRQDRQSINYSASFSAILLQDIAGSGKSPDSSRVKPHSWSSDQVCLGFHGLSQQEGHILHSDREGPSPLKFPSGDCWGLALCWVLAPDGEASTSSTVSGIQPTQTHTDTMWALSTSACLQEKPFWKMSHTKT